MKEDKRKQPRWFQKLRANLGGYFWLPCPICGENFGGQEWENGDSLMINAHQGMGVCANCIYEANERNKKVVEKESKYVYTWSQNQSPSSSSRSPSM